MSFGRFAWPRAGRWQYRLSALLLAMTLAGPLALAGREAYRELELRQASARRTQCAGGLKQLGIALHNYHDALGAIHPDNSKKSSDVRARE